MDYATAIREGCKVVPNKHRGCYDACKQAGCVNFAALVGLVGLKEAISIGTRGENFYGNTGNMVNYLIDNLPGIDRVMTSPCHCGGRKYRLRLVDIALHLNDHHKSWTREKIADWIESLG